MRDTLERCEDCRQICLCNGECACMVVTVTADDTVMACYACTDKRETTS